MAYSQAARRGLDMTRGPVLRPMIIYSIPIMLSGMLQLLFNAADVAVVGRFAGDNALAAVGSTSALCGLITNMFLGLSVGANVVSARAMGAGDDAGTARTAHTSMLLAILSGALLTVAGAAFAPVFLEWMGSPDGVIQLASVYLRIYFLGMIPSMIYNFGSAILRSEGDTRRPFAYLAIAGVLNLLLNMFFVIVCGMDVDGVALATVLSQCVSAALIVARMARLKSAARIDVRRLRLHRAELLEIVRIGLPAGLQSMVSSASNVLIQSAINSFGAVVVAGNSAANSLSSFVYMAMNAFYQSAISFSSQNFGAGKPDRLWKVLGASGACAAAVGLAGGNLAWYFGDRLLYLFTSSPEVVESGMLLLAYICIPYAICGVLDSVVGTLRGVGSSMMTMLITTGGICVFRVIWIYTVCRMPQFAGSIHAVYACYPIAWVITLAAQLAFFAYTMGRVRKGRLSR